MCDDYDDEVDSLNFIITEDENGNAVLRAPLPTVSFEMPEDELIRFLVALKNNEDTAKIIDGKPIGFERVVDETAFMVKLQEAVEVTNTESEILSRAISHYGEPAQVLKCIEELAELTISLGCHLSCKPSDVITDIVLGNILQYTEYTKKACKEYLPELCSKVHLDNVENHKNVASELADVSLTTSQMLKIFNCLEEVEKIKQEKLSRLEARMRGDSQ